LEGEETVKIKRTINLSGDFHYMIVTAELKGFTIETNIKCKRISKGIYDKLKKLIMSEAGGIR